MLLRHESYTPRAPQVFWCNRCDNQKVDSENPDTGRFFVVFGHVYDDTTEQYDGDYRGVMFAVCKGCLTL
jgi:hypothetical protein